MKNGIIYILAIVFLLQFPIYSVGAETSNLSEPLPVSLISLIANPSKYQGHYIRVVGYFRYEEGDATVYLSKDDAKHYNTKNCLWLYLVKKIKNPEKFDGTFAIIQGTFSSADKGRWQACAGSMKSVDRLEKD
jgi:hypothetical protein